MPSICECLASCSGMGQPSFWLRSPTQPVPLPLGLPRTVATLSLVSHSHTGTDLPVFPRAGSLFSTGPIKENKK